MGQIASTDVTYTINQRVRIGKRYFVEATLVYGDGSLTYATGGVTLLPAQLGFRRGIETFVVIESDGNALLYEFDISAVKLRIFTEQRVEQTAGATTIAATTLRVWAMGW